MNTREAYNQWADIYDEMQNKTRDIELKAKQNVLRNIPYSAVLELGCGTGKNTAWLLQKATQITAIDLSEGMINKAKERVKSGSVNFIQADLTEEWTFIKDPVDLITCSLVLEHIERLEPVFAKANSSLNNGGHFYIGELHPFKQYAGSKARFVKEGTAVVLDCYTHHISSFTTAAGNNGFSLIKLDESFDDDNADMPRILTLLFRKE